MLGVLRRHLTLGVSIGVVVTWMLASTGSLLLAVSMHASYAGWLLMLIPATSFEALAVWQTTLAAALLLVVAVVIVVVGHPRHPGRVGAYGGDSRG